MFHLSPPFSPLPPRGSATHAGCPDPRSLRKSDPARGLAGRVFAPGIGAAGRGDLPAPRRSAGSADSPLVAASADPLSGTPGCRRDSGGRTLGRSETAARNARMSAASVQAPSTSCPLAGRWTSTAAYETLTTSLGFVQASGRSRPGCFNSQGLLCPGNSTLPHARRRRCAASG